MSLGWRVEEIGDWREVDDTRYLAQIIRFLRWKLDSLAIYAINFTQLNVKPPSISNLNSFQLSEQAVLPVSSNYRHHCQLNHAKVPTNLLRD